MLIESIARLDVRLSVDMSLSLGILVSLVLYESVLVSALPVMHVGGEHTSH